VTTPVWQVPLTDLSITEADVEAVLDCLRGGWLTMGPRTQQFEAAFAEYSGAEHAVAVSSGTAALHLAMLALGIGPGDEVILPAFTFVAGAAAIRYVGAEPIFCDSLGDNDFNLDPADVAERITPNTKAVLAVHFMGYPARVAELRTLCADRGLYLIEDAAQAVGANCDGQMAGTVGDIGCFSFFSKKQLCVGEGGMVVSADEKLAANVRSLRSHAMTSVTWDRHRGHADSYDILDVGFNYRLDEARAALGLSRLPRLEADIAERRRAVRDYRRLLTGIDGIAVPWDDDAVAASSHFVFAVLLEDAAKRDAFRVGLRERGIQTTWYPALTQFTEYRTASGSTPRAEHIAERHCALPLSSHTSLPEIELVVNAVEAAVAEL